MGIASIVLSFCLLVIAAAPVALTWRQWSARLTALGIGAFGALVLAYQVLGLVASATHRPAVRTPGVLLLLTLFCAVAWVARWRVTRRSSWAGSDEASERAVDAVTTSRARPRLLERCHAPIIAALVVAGGFLACAAISGLSAPPRGWDILAYHLPRTVSWLLNGDLRAYGSTGAFYPGNAGLPILSLLFSGSDRLVPIIQLPFAILAGVALFGLARELSATARSAGLAVLVLLVSPIVFFQATIAKDDLVVTAMVLAGALFLARSLRGGLRPTERFKEVAASGFALGLALGTKYSVLPYVAASVPLLVFLHAAWAERDLGRSQSRTVAAALGVFVVAIAVPSAFWYIRNVVATGNPLAPLSLGVGEWIASPGVDKALQFVASPARWWAFPWTDRQLVAGYSGAAGYGAAFAVFLIPGLVLAVRGAASRSLEARARPKLLAVLLSIGLGVAGWWFGKYHLPRLLLPVVGLACAPVALVFDAVTRQARVALVVLLACSLGFSATETLRVTFAGNDVTWSYRGGIKRPAFYRMPDLIYEFPAGTRILLLRPSRDAFYETYRYPLAGELPGNDVVMEDDVGIGTNLPERGARTSHGDLVDRGVEYIFMRTLGVKRYTTWFDEHPDLYETVLDTTEPGYQWYRQTYAVSETGEILGRAIVMTKMYRVLPRDAAS